MNFNRGNQSGTTPLADAENDPLLQQALRDFRSSVHAWGDSEVSRVRTAQDIRHRSWRVALGWALGCFLITGTVSGGFYQRHLHQVAAGVAAQRAAEHQRQLAQQQSGDEEDLLATVDSDVSREVPAAMEPLAQLMVDDETK